MSDDRADDDDVRFAALRARASEYRVTVGELVRLALQGISSGDNAKAQKALEDILRAVEDILGVGPNAPHSEVIAKLDVLYDALGDACEAVPDEPLREAPDVALTLSQSDLAACKKLGIEPAELLRRKASCVTRQGRAPAPTVKKLSASDRAALAKGMTLDAFAAKKRGAARRV